MTCEQAVTLNLFQGLRGGLSNKAFAQMLKQVQHDADTQFNKYRKLKKRY